MRSSYSLTALITIVGFFIFISNSSVAAGAAASGPRILSSVGKVEIWGAQDRPVQLKQQVVLIEKAKIQTGPGAWVMIEVSPNEQIVVAPESLILIPVISLEDGSIERIELQTGAFRLMNLKNHPRVVLTPLSRDAYSEVDLVFELSGSQDHITVRVLEGRTSFRGLENEESVLITQGQKATFIGKKEDGIIMFDTLIGGRKVARGVTSRVVRFEKEEIEKWKNGLSQLVGVAKKKVVQKKSEVLLKGAICRGPAAKLNQCVWRCVGNPKEEKTRCFAGKIPNVQCVRERCDARGQWVDRTELFGSQMSCLAQGRVEACDY